MMPMPNTVIANVKQLREYLQAAMQLEHATIPPYLTAAYSAKIEANKPSIDIVLAVAKEEMLHLTLAANLLNAIGGQPDLISPGFVRSYPTYLPTGQDDFDVSLEKFSDHALKTFLAIERPTSLKPEPSETVQHINKIVPISGRHIDRSMLEDANPLIPITKVGDDKYELHYDITVIPHDHLTAKRRTISEAGDSLVPRVPMKSAAESGVELHYWSIGDFYKAIHLGFVELTHALEMDSLFIGDRKRQVATGYYSAGGELTCVTDLKSALLAIDFIAGQGEGSNHRVYDGEGELAHYYRFDQIQKNRYYRDPNKGGSGDDAGQPRGFYDQDKCEGRRLPRLSRAGEKRSAFQRSVQTFPRTTGHSLQWLPRDLGWKLLQEGDVPRQGGYGAAHSQPDSRHRRERRAYLRDEPIQVPAGSTDIGARICSSHYPCLILLRISSFSRRSSAASRSLT